MLREEDESTTNANNGPKTVYDSLVLFMDRLVAEAKIDREKIKGAGIVLNGRVFTGANKAAGEVCNLVTDADQLGQDYPGFGFLETKASGTAVARGFQKRQAGAPKNVDAEYVFKKAREGDAMAKQVIDDFTQYLSMAIVSIACVLDPELIVLGGGVANCADLFLPQLKTYPFLFYRLSQGLKYRPWVIRLE